MTTTYTYDSNGLRTSKTTGDDVTEYTYLGSSLVYQVTNKGQSDEVSLYFYYDETGIAAFTYKSAEYPNDDGLYYYIKNPQGDILGIVDRNGDLIARYDYSAYGEYRWVWMPEEGASAILSRNNRIKNANPFQYRGYYYDTETGLYYCQSRYYDPEVDRFINVDNQLRTGDVVGLNLFAYCDNDPVNRIDSNGKFWEIIIGLSLIKSTKRYSERQNFVSAAARGAIHGAVSKLPKSGEPDSSQTLPNPDGSIKQKRWYGPDGQAVRDRDYNHSGDMPFPHDHEWKDGVRQKDHQPPSPDYEISLEPVLGAGLIVICVVGIVVVAADDMTGIGIADNYLYGPLGAGIGKGIIMIFG